MIERGILYSAPMIVAKLEGRKTETRRTRDLGEINKNPDDWELNWFDYQVGFCFNQKSTLTPERIADKTFNQVVVKCPYGLKDDILYARETYSPHVGQHGESLWYAYKATDADELGPWKPSIHMPKVAARIWDRITQIRVERLQDITEEGAIAEGAHYFKDLPRGKTFPMESSPNRWSMESPTDTDQCLSTARWAFANYISKISEGKGDPIWDVNPWVWVIKTETLSTTGRPKDFII